MTSKTPATRTLKTLKTAPLPDAAQDDKFRLIANRAYIQELKDNLIIFFRICESDLQEQTGLASIKLSKEVTGVSLSGQEVKVYDDHFTLNGLRVNYLDIVSFLSGNQGFVSAFIPPSDKEPDSALRPKMSSNVLQFPAHCTLQ